MFSCSVKSEYARKLAVQRQDFKGEALSPRLDDKDPYFEMTVGLMGELAFQYFSNIPVNLKLLKKGDGGVDFAVPIAKKVLGLDVKSSQKDDGLLLKAIHAQHRSHILVYALVKKEEDLVTLVGWEHRNLMLLMPLRTGAINKPSHHRAGSQLRPMAQLFYLMRMDVDDRTS